MACNNEHITAGDGTRLAVIVWRRSDANGDGNKSPTVLINTRYWRAMGFHQDDASLQPYFMLATNLAAHGYGLVVADARGSGASFGHRDAEMSETEVEDISEVIDWIAKQDWSDGRVVTMGTSYSANTTQYSLVSDSPALKIGICRAPDFDFYLHLLAPGGIVNRWFIETWGKTTAAQDTNNVKALFDEGYWLPPKEGAANVLGVRPVDADKDGVLLASAIAEHKSNFNVGSLGDKLTFVDGGLFDNNRPLFNATYQQKIESNNTPLIVRCGWHDAGTQLGALCLFASFRNPIRVIIGPWNHEGSFLVDPFLSGDGTHAQRIPVNEAQAATIKLLDATFDPDKLPSDDPLIQEPFGVVEYFTLGENRWKTSNVWPLPNTQMQRLYLAEGHCLSTCEPIFEEGSDDYRVNPEASTGKDNRWYAQSPDKAILFPDRQEEDKKLLVYDMPPLEDDIEITGHPVVSLHIRSSAADGQFFVYLETVDPNGRVRLLTEGQLRGLHRKVSDEAPPYRMFGPYHTFKRRDAQPLVPGEVSEITFDLFPISVLLKAGQRLRLAIAGADKDTFAAIPGCEAPNISVERNRIYPSCIDLPTIQ